VAGGVGDPPSQLPATQLVPEQRLSLRAFAIDRTEITNAAFAVFTEMVDVHGIGTPVHAGAVKEAEGPTYPRSNIDWFDARAYCRFLGKDLPTSPQWQKTLRGGDPLPDGPNPAPTRNMPWLLSSLPAWQRTMPMSELARIAPDTQLPAAGAEFGQAVDPRRPAPVGSYPVDRSPYGVLDLAGNVQEWTLDAEVRTDAADTINLAPMRRQRMTRGGNWFDTPAASLKDYMATENPRSPRALQLSLGARRALQVPDAGSDAGNGTSTPPSSRNTPLDRSITPPGTLSGYKRTNRAPSRIVAR